MADSDTADAYFIYLIGFRGLVFVRESNIAKFASHECIKWLKITKITKITRPDTQTILDLMR